MATRTVIRYVCPQCAEDLNPPLALPPISPVATCRKCGFRCRRSIASTASAWMQFGLVASFLGGWAGLVLWHVLLFESATDAVKSIVIFALVALLLTIPGCLLGYFIGFIVGLINGAAWESVHMRPVDQYKAMAAAQADVLAQPSPELYRAIAHCPGQDGPLVVTKRCWHCGHVFEARDSRWEKVLCPQCKANLGVSSPRGEASYDPDE